MNAVSLPWIGSVILKESAPSLKDSSSSLNVPSSLVALASSFPSASTTSITDSYSCPSDVFESTFHLPAMDAGRFSRVSVTEPAASPLMCSVPSNLSPFLGLDDEEPGRLLPRLGTSIRSFPPEYLPDSMGFLPGVRG